MHTLERRELMKPHSKSAAIYASLIAVTCLGPAGQADVIIDEDFESGGGSFTAFEAYDYSAVGDSGNPSGGTTAFLVDSGSTYNYTDVESLGDYVIALDFSTPTVTSSRSLNLSLRSGAGNANLLNVAIAANGDDTLNIYNGSGWEVIGSGGEILDNHWYRITISGTMEPSGTYDVTVIDLENSNATVISEQSLAFYQTAPTAGEGSAYLELRNQTPDYAVDNFYFEANVPEPASLALLAIGTLCVASRRRHA